MFGIDRHFFSDIKEVMRARELVRYQGFMTHDFVFKGHNVYVNDTLCSSIGMPSRMPAACASLTSDGDYVIIVNQTFTKQRWNIIEPILTHEVGHIVHGHFDIGDSGRVINIDEFEFAADDYADACGTDIIGALEELSKYGFYVRKRIKRLKSFH